MTVKSSFHVLGVLSFLRSFALPQFSKSHCRKSLAMSTAAQTSAQLNAIDSSRDLWAGAFNTY
jgi:hypothetical protein